MSCLLTLNIFHTFFGVSVPELEQVNVLKEKESVSVPLSHKTANEKLEMIINFLKKKQAPLIKLSFSWNQN